MQWLLSNSIFLIQPPPSQKLWIPAASDDQALDIAFYQIQKREAGRGAPFSLSSATATEKLFILSS
jgi:hypothetical protein